ncbi:MULTISPECIES: hypothetical protein [unclassified Vibrio]|uniref:hypothetical protein n=1 Tax=unclassified Vibrio TaxID=2614977 RepID=UPI001361ACBD|nr:MULTISPECIES: hypothetical protein [unclassified Vibrio]NAW57178.1 hypothetical protein [Vibrio sp. V36_P2S2PM302]NAX20990.1 hypothetical protein [Vibrio sp. V39_P1S14PM300]NAX27621.1 hypothetical protein [Vibrio sp. V38_P2S17PM301]NAX29409.1 hypothetical protein [Vibrio sp. V37_P2S8PM304]
MGLVTNIERWEMPAAIGLATEGIRAKYNVGAGGGGFGAADVEIGSKLDGAKVLAAIERMAKTAPHLADWSMFAYASPLWNSEENKARLIDSVSNDWVVCASEQGVMIQKRTYERVKTLVPVIAGGLALEQLGGAQVSLTIDGLSYTPTLTKSYLIHVLAKADTEAESCTSETYFKKRVRYYQKHWNDWSQHVEAIRTLLINYDIAARQMFKKELENKNGTV